MVRTLVPARRREVLDRSDFASLADKHQGIAGDIERRTNVDADPVEARGMLLDLTFVEVQALAVHPLNGIHGGRIGGADCVHDLFEHQLLRHGSEVHSGHLESGIEGQKFAVNALETAFVDEAPIAEVFAGQVLRFEFLFEADHAFVLAVVVQLVGVCQLT
ncbi:hypothetical protein AOR11_23940 [Vibrio alginolyticus]|nr:hypothetical protein AOR11_23940 [Vibrio alginolyticus]